MLLAATTRQSRRTRSASRCASMLQRFHLTVALLRVPGKARNVYLCELATHLST